MSNNYINFTPVVPIQLRQALTLVPALIMGLSYFGTHDYF